MSMSNGTTRLIRLIAVCCLAVVLLGRGMLVPARAREATPTPAAPGSLTAMLRSVPDVVGGAETPPVQIASYADWAAQTAVSGMAAPTSADDPTFVRWLFVLSPLVVPGNLVEFALVADWHALLGVNLWEIDQTLEAGEPPRVYTLLRGRFDEAAIRAAWTSQGYRMLEVDGIAVASLHEDASFDITSDLGRFAFARFNNAALLPDGTLAYAPTLDGMRAVIAAAKGTAPSLGTRPDVEALLGAIAKPLASAMLLAGTGLQVTPDLSGSSAVASAVAGSTPMPPIQMALLGVTPGGPLARPTSDSATPQPDIPPATFEIAALLQSHDAAVTAARVATERLANGSSLVSRVPLTDYFASWDAHALPGSSVVVLELAFAPKVQPKIWLEMIYQRDLVFLGW